MEHTIELENQVCTLSQAKMLKRMGIIQMSLFYWIQGGKRGFQIEEGDPHLDIDEKYSAFTSGELSRLFPRDSQVTTSKLKGGTYTVRMGYYILKGRSRFEANHEVWARASALIRILEDGRYKAEEANFNYALH